MAMATISHNIPMDILFKIILLLPVKPLLRFKSVCKSWYALISSSDFIKSHLMETNSLSSSLVFVNSVVHRMQETHLMETNSLSSLVFFNSVVHPMQEISHLHYVPDFHESSRSIELNLPHFFGKTFRIIGSSYNGLICLRSCNSVNQLALFNPSTRLFKLVPELDYPFRSRTRYGFGYDDRGHDYKIVWVTLWNCMVYSFRTDSWKILKLHGEFPKDHDDGVLVNNRLHWKPETHDIGRILSFDLHDEEWSEVPMPNLSDAGTNVPALLRLGVLDGCLCVLSSVFLGNAHPHGGYTDVWMMMEYGVEESWTKVYRVEYLGVKLLGSCSEDGREILFSKGYGAVLFIWNSELKMMREIDNPLIRYYQVVKYVESLTPLTGNCHLLEEKKAI